MNSLKPLKSEMINLSRRNASLSGLNINSCVTFQEPLLSGNKNNEGLLSRCSLLHKCVFFQIRKRTNISINKELSTIHHIQALKYKTSNVMFAKVNK